jgi:hypothetical protein
VQFSYDPTTPEGQVRLLAVDRLESSASFSDSEITAFLTLNGGVVRLAAAQALEDKAARAAIVQGVTTIEGISVNGTAVAATLTAQAAELRRQYYEGDDGSTGSPIDWAEMVFDDFSYRDRLLGSWLRSS